MKLKMFIKKKQAYNIFKNINIYRLSGHSKYILTIIQLFFLKNNKISEVIYFLLLKP